VTGGLSELFVSYPHWSDGEMQELQAFRETLKAAQLVKEKVRLVREHPNCYPAQTLLCSELIELRSQVVETLAQHFVSFTENHWQLAQVLRNTCNDVLSAEIDGATDKTVKALLLQLSALNKK